MTVVLAVDRTGIPGGVATGAADVPEVAVGPAALAGLPAAAPVPADVPVVADKGSDADPLRDDPAAAGFRLLAPHRESRKRPARSDGRRMRRCQRRWQVERTFGWLHSDRRVATRFERDVGRHDGLVFLACAFITLNRLVK